MLSWVIFRLKSVNFFLFSIPLQLSIKEEQPERHCSKLSGSVVMVYMDTQYVCNASFGRLDGYRE